MSRLLPLFPLQLVVFPGTALPLHIFEDRYREMVGEAERAGTEFGIVLARDGGIVNAGCTVSVETVLKRYPDGRFDVMTRGQRRFRIIALDQEKAYLRGEVQFFEDDDLTSASAELQKKAIDAVRTLDGKVTEEVLDPGDPLLSFQLAAAFEDLDFLTVLQNTRSETKRLTKIVEFLRDYIPRREYAGKMKGLAAMNGSGHPPAIP